MKRLRHYQKGTAIVISCFGSVVEHGRYLALQEKIAQQFPDAEIRLAVSSRSVIKALAKKGEHFGHLPKVLAELDLEGYRHVLVVSTYLFPTDEHLQVEKIVSGFNQFSIANFTHTPAIIHHTHNANQILAALNEKFSAGSDINLFIHHGAPLLNNAGHQAISYCETLLPRLSGKNMTCSLEGASPFNLLAKPMVQEWQQRFENRVDEKVTVRLIPLLLVSGNHFIKDLNAMKAELEPEFAVMLANNDEDKSFCLLDMDEVVNVVIRQIEEGLIRMGVNKGLEAHG